MKENELVQKNLKKLLREEFQKEPDKYTLYTKYSSLNFDKNQIVKILNNLPEEVTFTKRSRNLKTILISLIVATLLVAAFRNVSDWMNDSIGMSPGISAVIIAIQLSLSILVIYGVVKNFQITYTVLICLLSASILGILKFLVDSRDSLLLILSNIYNISIIFSTVFCALTLISTLILHNTFFKQRTIEQFEVGRKI